MIDFQTFKQITYLEVMVFVFVQKYCLIRIILSGITIKYVGTFVTVSSNKLTTFRCYFSICFTLKTVHKIKITHGLNVYIFAT